MEFRQWHGIMTNFLPINKISPFGQCHIQTVLALQVHLISVNGPKWFDISKNLKHVSNRQVTPRSYPWPTTACSGCSCPSGQYEDSENGPKNDFQYPRIWGLKKIKFLAFPEAKLLHAMRTSLTSYSLYRPLAMVPNDYPYPKTWGLKKIRSLACIEAELLPEVLLDLLQPIQAVLALQVHLRPLAMVPNDSPYPKTWV